MDNRKTFPRTGPATLCGFVETNEMGVLIQPHFHGGSLQEYSGVAHPGLEHSDQSSKQALPLYQAAHYGMMVLLFFTGFLLRAIRGDSTLW